MIPKRLVDNKSRKSLADKLRRRRFELLLEMMRDLPRPVTILDLGGRGNYWQMMSDVGLNGDDVKVTIVNLTPEPAALPPFATALEGDARSLPQFADKEFDVAFSNSTIEHVGTFEDQKLMAGEVRRIGKRYYVQTPNRYFPIEPHFLVPLFQFLPVGVRVWLLQHFTLGWLKKAPDRQEAWSKVTSIRLLTRTEVARLFPNGVLFEERFCGLVKSFVAYTPPQGGSNSPRSEGDPL